MDTFELQFNEYIENNSKIDYNITNKKGGNNYNIEESIRFFTQPISIILENNKNDAYFIRAIYSYFDRTDTIKEFEQNGWIRFENAGGCTNVKNFIKGQLESYEYLAYKNNRPSFDYLRMFILLDSDREYAAQPQKEKYNTLQQYLNSINITGSKYHILQKRMMENYMPKEVFEELKITYSKVTDLSNWLNVYLNLSSDQMDFLNIKSGFPKDKDVNGVRIIDLNIKALYNLSQTNFDILDNGFHYPNFKNSFSELFIKSARVNKNSLKNRANSNELESILTKIFNLL